MNSIIEDRVLSEADCILKEKLTVRQMAKIFNVSKSTIHYDLSCRLKKLNNSLFLKVDKVLKFNLSVRHIRGGEATKNKYATIKIKDKKN